MTNNTRFNVGYAIAAVLAVFFIQYIISSANQVAAIPYSDFQRMLRDGKVATVGISDRFLQGTLKEPLPGGQKQFVTTRVDPEFAGELEKYGVRFTGQIESTFLRDLLSWIMPVLLFFGVWWYIGKRFGTGVGGGLMAIGKSKAKIYVEADTGVTFADVAGVDEAKDEVREIVDFLKGPAEYGRLGGRLPKGVLLVGPPGTGKTLLAKAIAGEAKVPFFSISGSEFVEMFVGVGAARVRDLFQQAHEKAPAIIFIDELDALGRARAIGPFAGGHDEKEQTLNQLLVELDGFDSRTGLVILAATNRPEILDPALLRAGRFDRQVLVDRPDKKGRVQILQVHMKKVLLASDVDVETIAALTPGFTGADLANLVNEAALLATRRGAQAVTTKDFSDAVERMELIVFGHLSTGAADDLRRVTDIARSMVTRYGMSEKLGNVAYDSDSNNFLAPSERAIPWRERQYAEQTAATVDHEVRAITDAVFKRAQGILQARRAILDRAARTLLEKETLERGDLDQFLREGSQGTTQVA